MRRSSWVSAVCEVNSAANRQSTLISGTDILSKSGVKDIMTAAMEMPDAKPMAIMGLFDISQRRETLANNLSITMPFALWASLAEDLDKSCLTTHAWKEIERRL